MIEHPISACGPIARIGSASAGAEAITNAARRPARFHVLDAEVTVIVHAAAASDTVASGTCGRPSRVRGEWISSEMTTARCSIASSASASRSARSCTWPVGLWGWQSRTMRAPAASAAASPSRSWAQPPSRRSSATGTTRRPCSSHDLQERRVDRAWGSRRRRPAACGRAARARCRARRRGRP